ncbi:MAG: hypothetical protein A2Y40_10270 [Candidatus Margulisbacteria bacterium GWF2_35_9]|nr:MAG: hypothetical protein A2Y40_10270 [Candidatus Margulisbacteria bacterium GWF2_35_9]
MRPIILTMVVGIMFSVSIASISEPDINTTRARGLSNAFVGLANDDGSLFFNPAGLAFVDAEFYNNEKDIRKILDGPKNHMNASVDFLFNRGYFGAIDYIEANKTVSSQLMKFNTGLEKKAYSKRSINMSFYSQNTGLSFFAIENIEHFFKTNGVVSNKDLRLIATIGESIQVGAFSIGASGKGELLSRQHNNLSYFYINSQGIQGGMDLERIMFSEASSVNIMNGVGFAGNIGIMTEWNNFRMGLSIENIIATDMELKAIKGVTTQNLMANEDWAMQNLMAGISYSDGDLVLAFDIHNLNRPSRELSYHGGLEKDIINFWILPKLRARCGASLSDQFFGYSIGLAFRIGIAQFNLSYLERSLNINKIADSNLMESKDQQININIELSF